MGSSSSRQKQTIGIIQIELFKKKYLLDDPINGRITFTPHEDLKDVKCFIQLLCHNNAEYQHNCLQTYKVDNVTFASDELLLCTLDNSNTPQTIDFRLEHNINRPSINLANGRLRKMQIEYNIVVSIKKGAQTLKSETVPIEMIEVNPNLNTEIYQKSQAIGLTSSWLCSIKPILFSDLEVKKLEYLAGEKCNIKLQLNFYPKQSVRVESLKFLLCQEYVINVGNKQVNPRVILDQVNNHQIKNEELQFQADLKIPEESQTQTSGLYMRTNYYIAVQIFFSNSQSRNNLEIIIPIKVWSVDTQKSNEIEFNNNDRNVTVSYKIPDTILNKIINYVPEQTMNLRHIGNPSFNMQFEPKQPRQDIHLQITGSR